MFLKVQLTLPQLVSQPILWLIMPLDKIRQPLTCKRAGDGKLQQEIVQI